ncbi:MAG TPA: methylated-DNA--[protein]-cysteine S-methyltransferase [Gemmatimonadales bacterium]|nr:methylated-DNA--[protein]-cysteine S-methyltransferase [Gemmatimonadales bacterium]
MSTISYDLFDSPAGRFGLAWDANGLTAVALPGTGGRSPDATLRRLLPEARPGSPPHWVRRVGVRVGRHLGGRPAEYHDVPLDLERVSPFHGQVYRALREVVPGTVVSYAWLARRAKRPGGARAVGQAMRTNPWPVVVPCHRVLAAGGRPGGYTGAGGLNTKRRLLAGEGVRLDPAVPGGGYRTTGLSFDPREGLIALARDPVARRMIRRGGPYTPDLSPGQSPYEALAEAIVYQQLSGKAAATIFGRVEALGGGRFPAPAELLALPEDRLRGAGLSRAKTAAVRDLAARTLDGTVPPLRDLRRLDDDAIIERLTAVRGVGRWTVEMLLLFRLGRGDVWPVDDLGVRNGFERATGRALSAKDLLAHGERWRPFRSMAAWYCWRALDG